MIIKCNDCIISFEVVEGLFHDCPNCHKPMVRIDQDLAHDGKLDFTPKFIRTMVLRPLN